MFVKRFLGWVQSAPAEARASATAALAQAFLGPEMNAFERGDAAAALTLMLEDDDAGVRRALAQVFASAPDAPRHIVLALAADRPEVAVPVLRHSPVLGEADLVDLAATSGVEAQSAIASRAFLPGPVAAALAEVGEAPALCVLLRRGDVALPPFSLARMAERFPHDPFVGELLLARDDLPPGGRLVLLAARFQAKDGDSVPERARREAFEKAAVAVARTCGEEALTGFVADLRVRGALTPALLLRALVSAEPRLFHAALAELSGQPVARVEALGAEGRGAGFAALCRKVALPAALVPVYRAAFAILAEEERGTPGMRPDEGAAFGFGPAPGRMLGRLLQHEAVRHLPVGDGVLQMLRRLEAEFARDEARRTALTLVRPRADEPLQLDASMFASPAAVAPMLQDNRPASSLPETSARADLRAVMALALQATGSPAGTGVARRTTGENEAPAEDLAGQMAETLAAHVAVDLAAHLAEQDAGTLAENPAEPPAQTLAEDGVDSSAAYRAAHADERPQDLAGSALRSGQDPSPEAGPVMTPAAGVAATAAPGEPSVPSFAAMAALLENSVAAALASLPPPKPRKEDWREIARKALVIEGEWVGVAVERGFDPHQFRRDAAA